MATVENLVNAPVEVAPAQAPDTTPAPETRETRPPRLSEALRYGQMNVKQSFGSYVDQDGNMCALGTIWYGMGYDVAYDVSINEFVAKYPEWGFLMEKVNTAPIREGICDGGRRCVEFDLNTLGNVVIHLNDQHRMPRDQIADRLSQFGL